MPKRKPYREALPRTRCAECERPCDFTAADRESFALVYPALYKLCAGQSVSQFYHALLAQLERERAHPRASECLGWCDTCRAKDVAI